MCQLFNLDDWDEDTDTIILDDIDFKYFPNWKSFMGCQKQFNVTDKYRKKRRVYGKLCIWLCNHANDPRGALSGTELDWYNTNVETIYLTAPLY